MEKKDSIFKGMFRKADLILIAFLILLGFLSLAVLKRTSDSGDVVARITVSGMDYGRYSLSESRTIVIETEFGKNILQIEDGCIFMLESDCPNHDCERFGRIRSQGQMIVCIPHRVVVTLEGGAMPEVDLVLY